MAVYRIKLIRKKDKTSLPYVHKSNCMSVSFSLRIGILETNKKTNKREQQSEKKSLERLEIVRREVLRARVAFFWPCRYKKKRLLLATNLRLN